MSRGGRNLLTVPRVNVCKWVFPPEILQSINQTIKASPGRFTGSLASGQGRDRTSNVDEVGLLLYGGRLTFDASLLELKADLQDYVIAHQLLHFHAPNHGKLWKSLMRACLGEYEELEAQLRRVTKRKTIRGG